MKKLIYRIKQFENHPITQNSVVKALFKYAHYKIATRINPKQKYNWINGLQFYVYKRDDAGIKENIYYGLYEYYDSIFILHFLREHDFFIDIGANVGHYSLLAAGVKKCKSIAVEPVPNTFKKLKENVLLNHLNDKIALQNIGVGNVNSELNFSTDQHTMNKVVEEGYDDTKVVKVPVRKMDDILSLDTTSLLKIDVEGYEKFAFEGGINTLKNENLKAVIAELNDSGQYYDIDDTEVLQMLLDHGFKPYFYQPENRELVPLDSYNKTQYNTIFIRDIEFVTERVKSAEAVRIWNKKI